ncbi:hypothetical protein N7445_006183 [Penicillium cf. griseofulvum]|nr:hypothetical protein N7445_006183 [Penicillium cf. griseofulvum]
MEFPKENLDLESNAQFEYDPWLLDDHPLRSHPTECIPALSLYLDEYYKSIGTRRAMLFRVGCLVFGCLAAFQCLRLLSINMKQTPPPHETIPDVNT